MKKPIHACMTKAVIGDGDQLECGPQWITSRRARLILFDDYLKCGNWTIQFDEIREAVLSSFRSPMLRIPGYVLAIRTDENTYHFGLNGWGYWTGDLPFPVRREQAKLRLSLVSLLARIALIGGILYLAWQKLGPSLG